MVPAWYSHAATAAALLAVAAPAIAQGGTIALRGGMVYTAVGAPIPNATILIRDGKIAEVGGEVEVSQDARVIDVAGKEVIPGMIDNHSHIGFDIRDVNERYVRFAPRFRITDVLSSDDRYWRDAV